MPLPDWERALFIATQELRHVRFHGAMDWFSGMGPWCLLVGWLAIRAWRRLTRRDFAFVLVAALVLVAVVDSSTSSFFKNLFKRLRPCKMPDLQPFIPAHGQGCGGRWGFFSSHASNVFALTHFLLGFARPSRLLWAVAWVTAALVALSRVYLGVHLPLDVLVGAAWGFALAMAWRWMVRMTLKGPIVP
jgi:undecaprenyl-diphosphatase